MLNFIMLSVIMLNVVMLNVVALHGSLSLNLKSEIRLKMFEKDNKHFSLNS